MSAPNGEASVSKGGPGGGRGRGRGGGKGAPVSREVMVSKKISWLLRHGAEKEGLKLDDGGYAAVDDMLQTNALKSLKLTFPELRQLVADNDKQRYTLAPKDAQTITPGSETPADYLIRANQGHSLKTVNTAQLLTPVTVANTPANCIHGTTRAAWPKILETGGLKPMGRNHVHFATGLPAAFSASASSSSSYSTPDRSGSDRVAAIGSSEKVAPVISGMRNSSSVLIWIDLPRALAAGVPFGLSGNGVLLSEGEVGTGLVGVKFFKRVEERGVEGGVLVEDGVVVGELKGGKGRGGGGGNHGKGAEGES